jgi:endonuclease/exonuclease/phosphatase (EEP) superfamily protein YafD
MKITMNKLSLNILYKTFIILMLTLTISFPMYMYMYKKPKQSKDIAIPAEGEINVLTFNTEYWHASENELVNSIGYKSLDVILLQEHLFKKGNVWGPTYRIPQLKEAIEDRFVEESGEIVTISKWPIVFTKKFNDGNPEGQTLRTDIAISGEVISIYNTHLPVHMHPDLLSNPMKFYKDAAYNAERRRKSLEIIVDDIEHNNNPVLIAGDFNSSTAMHATSWFQKNLIDSYAALHCKDDADTFSIGKFLHWRIDYIYTSAQLLPTGYCTKKLESISDHRAVLASFNLKKTIANRTAFKD